MTKVGIIRCQQTEDICPGTMDFKIASEGKMALMVERGAEAIVIASCISRGNPIDFPCPHYEEIKNGISKKVGSRAKIIEWTH